MCAYLMERGVSVTIWDRDSTKMEEIGKNGIRITGCCAGLFHPRATAQIEQAVSSSQYLLVMTTAEGHLPIAKRLHGLLRPDQRILIFNGNWGAYEFCTELGQELAEKNVVVSETGSRIFLADYDASGAVHIKKIKNEIAMASVPKEAAPQVLRELADVLPQLLPEDNVLCTSFNNSNPVIHTPITLFNFTRVENGEDFFFYGQAATRSVIRYIEKVDEERCRVAHRIGIRTQTCLEIINSFWPDKYDDLYDAIKCNEAYQTGKGPTSLNYRYISEDVPFGMAPVAALGKRYGVPTPYIDAMLACYRGLLDGVPFHSPDFSRMDVTEML